jgi:hypothetical protein
LPFDFAQGSVRLLVLLKALTPPPASRQNHVFIRFYDIVATFGFAHLL